MRPSLLLALCLVAVPVCCYAARGVAWLVGFWRELGGALCDDPRSEAERDSKEED